MISVRFNSEEEKYLKEYAKLKGISVSQLIKDSVFDKIEDELGLTDEEEQALAEYDESKGRPLDEFWAELGI